MEKFRECADIENGETLHITQDAEMADGSHWGVTTVDGTEGWVDLEKTEEWKAGTSGYCRGECGCGGRSECNTNRSS